MIIHFAFVAYRVNVDDASPFRSAMMPRDMSLESNRDTTEEVIHPQSAASVLAMGVMLVKQTDPVACV